jgi:dTDP-4-amino-4,6-dideoxygalactose transaminase
MDKILDLAREYGLKLIEDCAQLNGATYKGHPVCSLGAFSFCQDKIVTTAGEGGKTAMDSDEMYQQALRI